MKKVFTLLLSTVFCAASPVLAMETVDPQSQTHRAPAPKKITVKWESYYLGNSVPSIVDTLGEPESTFILKVPAICDSVMETLAEGIESNSHPFDLTILQGATLTPKGIASFAKIIENDKLINLTIFRFQDASLGDSIMFPLLLKRLNVCSHLRQGHFCNDSLREEDTMLLSQKFPSLQKLDITAKLPSIEFLKPLSQLTSLDLSNCHVGDTDFSPLGYLTNLHTLNLSTNNIKINATQLINCPSLTDLNLSGNYLGNSGAIDMAEHFVKLPKLKKLNLSSNQKIGNDGILALVKNLTQLEELNVFNNVMDDEGGKRLAEILGTRFDPQNFRQIPIQGVRLTLNVAYNKMTKPTRASLQETLNSSAGTSVGMTW